MIWGTAGPDWAGEVGGKLGHSGAKLGGRGEGKLEVSWGTTGPDWGCDRGKLRHGGARIGGWLGVSGWEGS